MTDDPTTPTDTTDELSDDQLEAAAGGAGDWSDGTSAPGVWGGPDGTDTCTPW